MFNNIMTTVVFIVLSSQLMAQDGPELDSDQKKYSYAVGNKVGQQIVKQFSSQPNIDLDVFLQGIAAVFPGNETALSDQETNEIIQKVQQEELAAATAQAEMKAETGKAFLESNKNEDGVMVTASGLQYKVLVSGEDGGTKPTASDTVVVHYKGTLMDGTEFDSSYSRNEPATFGLGSIIPGWQEVLQLMKPGDKWAVVLPPELAYGEQGAGKSIGPNEILLFDIELLEVKTSSN